MVFNVVPLPPANAEVWVARCDECSVACTYKRYRWPVGQKGGVGATDNIFARELPEELEQSGWIAPEMHNIAVHEGVPHHVVVAPNPEAADGSKGPSRSRRDAILAEGCYDLDKIYMAGVSELIFD